LKFESLLARNVRGLWATSYSFGLRLFDQYMLRRVSQSPLNAVVLIDEDKLAGIWENLADEDHHLARKAGHRYLVRGMRPAGGGAFHPKTYLFSRAQGATLVVGSGNLTADGIDRGHEVFTSFDTRQPQDLPSLRAYGKWMSALVEEEDDLRLRQRWIALREDNPWLTGPADGTMFIANQQRSILDQFAERLPDSVAELHVTAPFFDRDARALKELVGRCDPDRLLLYLGAGTKVHGPSLAKLLRESVETTILQFDPAASFVHAKLIGAIGRGGEGVLLSGSPNLSRAALSLVASEQGGNCETAVTREGSAEQVREVFESSRLDLAEVALEVVDSLEFEEEEAPESSLGRLRNAIWLPDGRIEVEAPEGVDLDAGLLAWAEAAPPVPIRAGATLDPMVEQEPRPVLVWLVDERGLPLTNRVPVEDPVALEETLTGSQVKRESRPAELEGLEAVPLVKMVLWANDNFIFDLDQTKAFGHAQKAAEEELDAEDETGFWDRYAKEELQYDPRSQTYKPLSAGGGETGPVEELLRELQAMLYAAPKEPVPSVWVVGEPSPQTQEETKPGTPWTMEARYRVRTFNLFMRWSKAIADPRHRLLDPRAPAVNYTTLLSLILASWIHQAFDRKQLQRLLLTLLTSFVGSKAGEGFLGRSDEGERNDALCRLDPFVLEAGAGLVAAALQVRWRGSIYDWQPVLRRALDFEVLLSGENSVRVHQRLTGQLLSAVEINDLLGERLRFVDDGTWCKRITAELELEKVTLDLHRNAKVRSAVTVLGVDDPLRDSRLLTVTHRFLDFKRVPSVALFSGQGKDVMIFKPGAPARAMIGGTTHSSSQAVDLERLEEIERQGGSWSDLLELERPAAAAA
jgi:hypothetical protein